jgi:hypothetical protein
LAEGVNISDALVFIGGTNLLTGPLSIFAAISSYEVIEGAPYLGETRTWIGDVTWKRLDRPTVEALVGGKV